MSKQTSLTKSCNCGIGNCGLSQIIKECCLCFGAMDPCPACAPLFDVHRQASLPGFEGEQITDADYSFNGWIELELTVVGQIA